MERLVHVRLKELLEETNSFRIPNAQWRLACEKMSQVVPILIDLTEAVHAKYAARCWSRNVPEDHTCLCGGEYVGECPCNVADLRIFTIYRKLEEEKY
jgi:hypothetical protein